MKIIFKHNLTKNLGGRPSKKSANRCYCRRRKGYHNYNGNWFAKKLLFVWPNDKFKLIVRRSKKIILFFRLFNFRRILFYRFFISCRTCHKIFLKLSFMLYIYFSLLICYSARVENNLIFFRGVKFNCDIFFVFKIIL